MLNILHKIVGSSNQRYIKSISPLVPEIRAREAEINTWSDEEIRQHTKVLQQRVQQSALDGMLPEAFAMVCVAAQRSLGMRPFDVQLLGGISLDAGKIAEMRTGEGKTLVATLPVYLNALSGKGSLVVTVNDYLARRDSEWMGKIYEFMGMTIGCVVPGLDDSQRQQAYQADITYITNSELGFDYLRDNLKFRQEQICQREFNFALIDEVDNILIDEARTPLIISGAAEGGAENYQTANGLVSNIAEADYEVDEKNRNLYFTDTGLAKIEDLLTQRGAIATGQLFDVNNIHLVHHMQQALRAHRLYSRDVDYIVKDGKVVLIDEFTGRMMEGRRLSEGLHQALEAKERLTINRENQTVASITYQNLFRQFPKLCGMTGTAMTEAGEFEEIYQLGVVEIPTHRAMIRVDQEDEIYRRSHQRNLAVVDEIKTCHERGQPILIGTVSIEKSEQLSKLLRRERIKHNVLNARHHAAEAQIIADAGRLHAVTIATNMAGRGTDIQLGGNLEMRLQQELGDIAAQREQPDRVKQLTEQIEAEKQQVIAAGGLLVVGTERHESRRIDNQLRGRAGRQGDPGRSRFYISLEDDLMRVFGAEKMDSRLGALGLKEDESLAHPWLSKAIEKAQSKVEQMHFDVRKQLLRFDDVLNDQRNIIFKLRRDIMSDTTLNDTIAAITEDVVADLVALKEKPQANTNLRNADHTTGGTEVAVAELTESARLTQEINRLFAINITFTEGESGASDYAEQIQTAITSHLLAKEQRFTAQIMRQIEKHIVLTVIDNNWRILLQQMEELRRGIGLRAYGQRDPLIEYKREAMHLFYDSLSAIKLQVMMLLCKVEVSSKSLPQPAPAQPGGLNLSNSNTNNQALRRKVPRNAPCPCGSGKKYKHCHGKLA